MKSQSHYFLGCAIMFSTALVVITGLADLEKKQADQISQHIAQPLVIDKTCDYVGSGIMCFCLREQKTNDDCVFELEMTAMYKYFDFNWSIQDMENLYMFTNLNPNKLYTESK